MYIKYILITCYNFKENIFILLSLKYSLRMNSLMINNLWIFKTYLFKTQIKYLKKKIEKSVLCAKNKIL